MVRRKKAAGKSLLIIIIVMVAIIISAIVVANAAGTVIAGLLEFFGPSCRSIDTVHKYTSQACQDPTFDKVISLYIPKNYRIFVVEYYPDLNGQYQECIGGLCLCLMQDQWQCESETECEEPEGYEGPRYIAVPPKSNCRYCKPLAVVAKDPVYCCIADECEFMNVAEAGEGKLQNIRANNIIPFQSMLFYGPDLVWSTGLGDVTGENEDFCRAFGKQVPDESDPMVSHLVYSYLDYGELKCCYSSKELSGPCQNLRTWADDVTEAAYHEGAINISLTHPWVKMEPGEGFGGWYDYESSFGYGYWGTRYGLPSGNYKIRISRTPDGVAYDIA